MAIIDFNLFSVLVREADDESVDFRADNSMFLSSVCINEFTAATITEALGGRGIFGVELFIKGTEVIFSEVSPRPHDTGMVTMISQDLSQFALHARAIMGLPIPGIHFHGPSASSVILVSGESDHVTFNNINAALQLPDTQVRLFGKPEVKGQRRMGVALARDNSVEQAKQKAIDASSKITANL